jgi:hypothetical protein
MRHGRFITTAAAAVAVLAIGPASAMATAGSFTDDSYADFAAGAPTNAWIVEPGEVRLQRTTALGSTNFDGGSLPTGWVGPAWSTGGAATVGGGSVTVDGARVHDTLDPGTFPAQSLEFRATFGGDEFQNVGLGNEFDAGPWAMFSTGGASSSDPTVRFWARTLGTTAPSNLALPANIDPATSHLYRIDWTSTGPTSTGGTGNVKFYVDNALVATSTDNLSEPMRPVASDYNPGGNGVKVDWFNLGPYPTSGGFESRVFDAGTDPDVTWGSLIASAAAGAPVIETRTGNTPNPNDGTWNGWQGLSGNVITSPRARYIQYRTTALTAAKPSLEKVVIGYDVDTTTPSTGGSSGGSTAGGTTITGGSSKSSGGSNSQVDTTKPKVTLVAKSLKASKTGTVSFTVGCPATEQSCKITLKLKNGKKTVASKTVNVKGGKRKTVTLTLNKATKSLLKKRSSLKVSAVTTATDAAGNTQTTTKAMTLRRAAG